MVSSRRLLTLLPSPWSHRRVPSSLTERGHFLTFFLYTDTKRREPYLFEQPIQGYIRDAIRLRYIILPAMYTAFYEASLSGVPILRCGLERRSRAKLGADDAFTQASIRRLPQRSRWFRHR
jgi:hypothetical protein